MDGEDDNLPWQNGQSTFANDDTPLDGIEEHECEDTATRNEEIGDMTFCMTSYVKGVMKMMHIMRSHHMLTDVILEVGSEVFHAHKVILAAASPYFKVNNK